MRILGLIPARGGSKGIPGKNIKLLGDKPLLAYTAEAALKAPSLANVLLTTDDPDIAAVGRGLGLSVPFLRPADLASDRAPTLPVIQHALTWLAEKGEDYDAVCLLQPTNPFRTSSEIEKGISVFRELDADTVVSVREVPKEYHPEWVYLTDATGALTLSTGASQPISRRQDLSTAYHRDGSLYIARTRLILEENTLYGRHIRGFVPTSPYLNLDTPADWARAEALLAQKEGN